MNEEKKRLWLSRLFLGITIWCFVCAGLGIYAIVEIFSQNKGCSAVEGTLLEINYFDNPTPELMKIDGTFQYLSYNIEIVTNESGVINAYPVQQNLTREYLEKRYTINETYLINTCDGKIREIIDDNKFNRWIS